ncbi:hypothetical protein KBC80_02310 [Candidatus Woesebacteria bacterium]|nr:hypothetical protein [Candidatus Woesebacteria bacterium]
MHRNTLLFVSSLAVVAAFLVGTLVGRNLPRSSTITVAPAPTPSIQLTPTPVSLRTYMDKTCDLSLEYPSTLEILESTDSGTILTDPNNDKDTVIVVCQTDIPRVPLAPNKITTVILQAAKGATVSAKIYHDASAKDGAPIDKLIFTHPTSGMDVLIGGFGAMYDRLITSVKIN